MENSSSPEKHWSLEKYWSLRPFESRVALEKWNMLLAQGYIVESTNEYGIVFKKHRGTQKGFIDWWGKVTWEE
jgi:hypothetical protein